MVIVRWLRSLVMLVLGLLLVSPVVALPLAVLVDRGPVGEARIAPHLFPLVLWLFDDFAWTCSRNSLIFAATVSLLSLAVGGVSGWVVGRRRFWGRAPLRALLVALIVMPPAFLALGLESLFGTPRAWPWPFVVVDAGTGGVSLESWRGGPLWFEWIWTTLPAGIALVMVVTAAAVERLEPSWEDAARLTGVGRFRAWHELSWPLVRPASARAAAIVFVFALADPGAPLILGLRRTLAFQLVEATRRPDPFPQAAVWALAVGLLGLIGWLGWRWAGGTPILAHAARSSTRTPAARPVIAIAAVFLLTACGFVGWLPVAGLVKLSLGEGRPWPRSSSGAWQAILDHLLQLGEPPVPAIVVNSLTLGLEVACVLIALACLRASAHGLATSQSLSARVTKRIAFVPPLIQGVGLLTLAWLAGLASDSMPQVGRLRAVAVTLGRFATELDLFRNPWLLMSLGVALSLVPRFLILSRGQSGEAPAGTGAASAVAAARLAGVSLARAAQLGQFLARGRWLAGAALAGSLAATNLVPALLFEPWVDGQTITPAVLDLAVGPADARGQAALLALGAIALNLTALAMAWLLFALPRSINLE